MDWSFRQNWDEYAWSREIRKDELRIAGYFRALPGCLDLPGEDEMIFNKLMSQPELVPTGVTDPQRTLRSEFEQAQEEAADWEEERREARRRGNFAVVQRMENLSVEWNLLLASPEDVAVMQEGLPVTCASGKLLSRMYNFVELEDAEDTLSLRIGLLKRMLADLNELISALDLFRAKKLLPSRRLSDFFTALAQIREQIIDRLNELRS